MGRDFSHIESGGEPLNLWPVGRGWKPLSLNRKTVGGKPLSQSVEDEPLS